MIVNSDRDTLPSWNDGLTKQSIINFLKSTSTEGSEYIKPEERIAVFDNDGTLWVEQPAPVQVDFMFRAFLKATREDPSLADKQPYKAIIEKDRTYLSQVVEQRPDTILDLENALAHVWGGKTPDEFEEEVKKFINTAKHVRFSVCYTDLVYKPMLELFELLRTYEYRIFVCSSGGRDFMRVIAEKSWGISKENVIGTAPEFEYKKGSLKRMNKVISGISLGPGKVEHIFAHTGRLPVFAAGNGDGDIEMMDCAKFKLLINHDDTKREYSYDKGAERALNIAKDKDYKIVSIKNDWKEIF
jgi:phosphoglycolate phosphatase-like HAD superfamily hydrolase